MRILTEAKVYLVGKTEPSAEGFQAFLEDNGLSWPTPNQIVGHHDDKMMADVPENQTLIEMFGRNCYMSYGVKAGSKTNRDYLDNLIGLNRPGIAHGSVTEHINYNFMVVGGGRGFSHEQVRHRTGVAYSQLSTRYCDFEREEEEGTWEPGFCIPPLGQLSEDTKELFKQAYIEAVENYKSILLAASIDIRDKFAEKIATMDERTARTFVRKAARGVARDVLPIGTEAIMGMTANCRALFNMIVMRASEHAEASIRDIYVQITKIMVKELPDIFGAAEFKTGWDGTEYVVMPREKL